MTPNREFDVVVVGGINTDYLIRGMALPKAGQTLEGEVFLRGPGGKGANQAVAAARLGAHVAMVGRVGSEPRGEEMIEALAEEGIDTDFIVCDEHAETGAALVMVAESGEKQIMASPGANRKLTVYDVLKAEPAIRTARVVLGQFEVPPAAIEEAFRIAKTNNVTTVLDPAPPRQSELAILRSVDIIRPNRHEAEVLTGLQVTDRNTARSAAQQLLAKGIRAVVIQAGSEGDLLVWAGGEHWLPRIPVETVDATGAGDAFAGGLAFALSRGKSLVEAAQIANATAALSTMKLGAQAGLPALAEVESLLSSRS